MSVPNGTCQVGAQIEHDAIEDARIRNGLSASYSRSDVMRYCIARAAGLDHYDAMREAESMGRKTLAPKAGESGLTSVTVNVAESLLEKAMQEAGTNNRSQAVRWALGVTAKRADLLERANRGPRGRKPAQAREV